MPIDLRRTRDNPSVLLNRYAADAYSEGRYIYGDHYSTASTRLYAYEIENAVTFAALDNFALQAVQRAWKGYIDEDRTSEHRDARAEELANQISILLGLGE